MKYDPDSAAASFPSALDAAQHYLDWYMPAHRRTADRVVVGLRPKVHIEILCTDGYCAPVDGPFHDTLCKVLARENDRARIVVAEIKRQKIAEGIS